MPAKAGILVAILRVTIAEPQRITPERLLIIQRIKQVLYQSIYETPTLTNLDHAEDSKSMLIFD